jgi:hypothetical protein
MSDDWNINQKRYDDQKAEKLLEDAKGYGPGRNDLFAWGFIIGGGLGLVVMRTMGGALLMAFGGLAIAFALRALANLVSRK